MNAVSNQVGDLHLFGIRHHGPGSALSLIQALERLQPDIILVEGPPEGNAVLPLLVHEAMEPPVSLLIYRPDNPKLSGQYPFATFSPEWQAIRFAMTNEIPVRFMDLPQKYRLTDETPRPEAGEVREDPFKALAEAAGYDNHEAWWNAMIEERQDDEDLFGVIIDVMTAVRESAEAETADLPVTGWRRFEARREAHMRRAIREARAEGHGKIAIVCGAWHTPALIRPYTAEEDEQILAGVRDVEVWATWVPWTYSRLWFLTGYGAGISSPGWYHHLWVMGEQGASSREIGVQWLSRVARLLREDGLDASSAHVIEAVRLSESLAALRGRAFPGLNEFNEAVRATYCFGDDAPLQLINTKLIVGDRMGRVPPETPKVPLQRDLEAQQEQLSLVPTTESEKLELDLRKTTDLAKSQLLHRLNLLRVPWGKLLPVRGHRGTYAERWNLRWMPDMIVRVIEASMYGNQLLPAATAYAVEQAEKASELPELTSLLDQVMLADLPAAVEMVMTKLDESAALSHDVLHMMDALFPLVRVMRYGNVRQTNQAMVKRVVDGLVARICIGVPRACQNVDDEAASELFDRLNLVHAALMTLQDDDYLDEWLGMLWVLADRERLHGLLAGRVCRLLFDAKQMTARETGRRLTLALSGLEREPAFPLLQAAFWIEGFLKGSGLLILHDDMLLALLDEWLSSLPSHQFVTVLPLLRRTFSEFNESVRERLTKRLRRGLQTPERGDASQLNEAIAAQMTQMVTRILRPVTALPEAN